MTSHHHMSVFETKLCAKREFINERGKWRYRAGNPQNGTFFVKFPEGN